MRNFFLFITFIVFFTYCESNDPPEHKSELASEDQQGVAKEVLQTSNYTYILVNTEGKEIWLAGPKIDAIVGKKYYFVQNMIMENFQSKELNKFFDTILFVQEISAEQHSFKGQSQSQTDYKADIKVTKQNIKIDQVRGTISIADVYSNKNKYNGTKLTVRGVVTKYNPEIMGKNWIHLQDGTEKDGHFELVVTSFQSINLGDTAIFEGRLVLDKDFGYGYKYDVLLEESIKK